MRRAARVDANQAEVIATFRRIGATVQDLSAVGAGCPDLLVGFRGATMLVEVKDGAKAPSARKLTNAQVEWHATWAGAPVEVVASVDDALRVLSHMAGA